MDRQHQPRVSKNTEQQSIKPQQANLNTPSDTRRQAVPQATKPTSTPQVNHSPAAQQSRKNSDQISRQQNKQSLARNTQDRRTTQRRMNSEQRSNADRRLNEYRLAPGEYIFKEGDKSEFGYVVVSGVIEICKLVNGEYRILSEITAGALFGEMAIIDNGDRSASARAKDDALVREIDEKALKTYFTQSPDVALDMMRRLSQYVRSSNQALEVSVFDSPGTSKTTETPEKEESERTKLLTCAKDNQFIIDQFQAPADAFVKTRMPPIVHKTFWTIALMFCLFLAWSTLSVIDTTLSAPGKLTTVVPKIPVQAGSNGMVKSVQVTPGQEVKKGDVIATIDHTLVEADYNKIQKRNAHLKEKIKRLQLEISNAPLAEGKQLTSQAEQDIYELRWKEHNAKLKSFDIELHNIASALKTAQSNVNISEIELKENEHQYRKQKRLVDEKIVSSTALEEAQFRVDKTRARLKNSLASLDVAQKNYEAKMMDKKAYNNTRLKQLNDEHFAAIKQLEADTEELIKIDHQRTNTEIFSPVDGVVLEIEGLFVGAIVNVGEVVTTLVPTNVPLTVEMDINPKNIGNLSLGNEVSIKLSALPYQKHGDLSGKITFVSEDTVDTSITGQPGTFYRARADIISNNLKKLPKDFHLVPGMQINGDIRVGKRRVITYFLYPVIRTIETSFQEP